jgi:tyrosine aminotransferase
LTLGDPTKNPLLQPPAAAPTAVIAAIQSGAHNGYGPTDGLPATKAAVAAFHSVPTAGLMYAPADVVMTNGTASALDLVITALGRAGSSMLFPRPGFAYSPSPNARRVEDRYYNLLPDREWEVDLEHLATLVDENTAALVLNKYVPRHMHALATLTLHAARRTPAARTTPRRTSPRCSTSPPRGTCP